jgi:ornithine cyclodeaminase
LLGIIVGDLLGAWRTGALGGVAVKYLSRADAQTCAVIGTGNQARTQLLGTLAARNLGDVRVYSRDEERRKAFAAEMSSELHCPVRPVGSAFEAIADADIVLCATNSPEPVLDVQWLAKGTHVSTVGPKVLSSHELPRDIGSWATVVATDSIEQMQSYKEPYFLDGISGMPQLHSLAGLASGNKIIRREDETNTLYCSVGLAGTEVAIAAHIIARYREAQHL